MSTGNKSKTSLVIPFLSQAQILASIKSIRSERVCLYIAIFSLPIPVWLGHYPPLIDIPQHAAQIATFIRLNTPGSFESEIFQNNFFTPYLTGYLLTALVGLFTDIDIAVKIILSLGLMLFPVSCALLRRELGLHRYIDWLALPSAYSFSFGWGFLNYIIAAPVAIILMVACLKHSRLPSVKTEALIFFCSLLLFFCHILALAFFTPIALSLIINQCERNKILSRCRPFFGVLLIAILWILQDGENNFHTHNINDLINWPISLSKLEELLVLPYAWPMDLGHILLSILILSVPFLLGERFTKNPARIIALSIFIAEFLFLPTVLLNVFFIYQRLAMFLVPMWLLIFTSDQGREKIKANQIISTSVVFIMILHIGQVIYVNGVTNIEFEKETAGFDQVLERISKNRKVLFLPFDYYPPSVHLAAWYQALKGGVVNPSFSTLSHMLSVYKPNYALQLPPEFVFATNTFNRLLILSSLKAA